MKNKDSPGSIRKNITAKKCHFSASWKMIVKNEKSIYNAVMFEEKYLKIWFVFLTSNYETQIIQLLLYSGGRIFISEE